MYKDKIKNYYEPFVEENQEFDLQGSYEIKGVLFKTVKTLDNDTNFENFEISEHGRIRNKTMKKYKTVTVLANGLKTITLTGIDGSKKTFTIKDLVAATFLKIPENAIMAVHKKYKDNGPKYLDISDHYTNLVILTKSDFRHYTKNVYVSKYGDFYVFRGKNIKNRAEIYMLKQNENKQGVKFVEKKTEFLGKVHYCKRIVVEKFSNEFDPDAGYIIFKDGNKNNNHINNLTRTPSLTGIFSIGNCVSLEHLGCSDYCYCIDDNSFYSYKSGTFVKKKDCFRIDRYRRIYMIDDEGIPYAPLKHDLVMNALDPENTGDVVDHINGDRSDNRICNLRRTTFSENAKNIHTSRLGKGRKVVIYSQNGEILEKFNNADEAGKKYNISSDCIRKTCRLNMSELNRMYYGKYWGYDASERYDGDLSGFKEVIIPDLNLTSSFKIDRKGILIDKDRYIHRIWGQTYPEVKISGKNYRIHIIIGYLFVPGRTAERNQINHIDEDIKNFDADNLEWRSQSENIKHSIYKQYLPVTQIDVITKKVVKVFPSRADVSEFLTGRRSGSSICKAIKNNSIFFGFRWRDSTEEEKASLKR